MTKRVNKIFLVIAIAFILLSVIIPIIDYYMSKTLIFEKVEGLTANEMMQFKNFYENEMTQGGYVTYYSFYEYFVSEYGAPNPNSYIYKAIEGLTGTDFNLVLTWSSINMYEGYFIWYILDKIIWLFIAYCIFVIPISMVDLFSKAIKKGVE